MDGKSLTEQIYKQIYGDLASQLASLSKVVYGKQIFKK